MFQIKSCHAHLGGDGLTPWHEGRQCESLIKIKDHHFDGWMFPGSVAKCKPVKQLTNMLETVKQIPVLLHGGNTPRYQMAICKLHVVICMSAEVKINCFGKKIKLLNPVLGGKQRFLLLYPATTTRVFLLQT